MIRSKYNSECDELVPQTNMAKWVGDEQEHAVITSIVSVGKLGAMITASYLISKLFDLQHDIS